MGSPGTTLSVLAGSMKSLVTIRLSSGRAEMPCGLNPSAGGVVRPLPDQVEVLVELRNATRGAAGGGSHLSDQESSLRQRKEVVGDAGKGRTCGEQEPRFARLRNVKEENPVLSAQQAEEAAASKRVLVGRQVAVVRLVADVPGGGIGTVLTTLP